MGTDVFSAEELAYAAGIIDGEGSIVIGRCLTRRKTPIYSFVVEVAMADREAVDWFHKSFGGGLYEFSKPERRKSYRWQVGTNNAKKFLMAIIPYLKVKQKQAELAIKFQNQRSYAYHCGNPKPQEVIDLEKSLYEKLKRFHKEGNFE